MAELILAWLFFMLGIWLVALNILSAIVVIYDKHLSKKPRGSVPRIPEKAFVRLSLLGGGFGTFIAMLLIRHKTKSHDFLLLKIALGTILWIIILLLIFKFL